jgi:dynein heavy chain
MGTGKTIVMKYYIEQRISEDVKFQPLQISFSANTQSVKLQKIIQSKLERQRKGYYAPPMEKTLVVIADDMHMPKLEIGGA